MQVTVIMLAYSAMKNAGELHAAVFGVEAGHQFVFGFRQIERHAVGFGEGRDEEDDEADDLRERPVEDVPVGKNAAVEPAWPSTISRRLSVLEISSGAAMASAIGSS